ncbi:endonuclease/exonuclease/phosphatase family protein [Kitasatospora cystarginea]|uniref:Endonuclease/exonuclease/phosphatase family protein n=1 Tax=Kitasatospora cystarginea TaxID=58350 RepID=A0ABP5R9I5_9ACTN
MTQQLLFPAEQAAEPSTTELRVLTLNVQHASPARSRRQAAWLAEQAHADVVVLTEVGAGPGGDALEEELRNMGYRSMVAPSSNGDYRTVLAARAEGMTAAPAPVEVLPHRFPLAHLAVSGQQVAVAGLYVPSRGPKERRNEDKRKFQAAVASALPGLLTQPDRLLVVLGDLNVVEPGHQPHHPVFGPWEYDFYRAFAEAGLTDAYRTANPDAVEHSWYGRGGNGYRFDHAFTKTNTERITACAYLHETRANGLSDHSALVLRITIPATEPSQ